jgi:transposase
LRDRNHKEGAVKAQNYIKKKIKLYKERDAEKRQKFIEEISKYPQKDIVYVDESGINEYMYREKARALRGKKVVGEVSGKKFQRVSIIAGKCGKHVYAPFIHNETTNADMFNFWLEECLLPEIGQGKVIVMDNASFHKSEKTLKLIQNSGNTLLYLPPYSPDLNPIERFWGNFKRTIRSILANFSSLDEAINFAFAK